MNHSYLNLAKTKDILAVAMIKEVWADVKFFDNEEWTHLREINTWMRKKMAEHFE